MKKLQFVAATTVMLVSLVLEPLTALALGQGVGYTVAVTLEPDAPENRRSAGAFGWGGAFGTLTWTDPAEELTAVIFLQQADLRTLYAFQNAVRQAIID